MSLFTHPTGMPTTSPPRCPTQPAGRGGHQPGPAAGRLCFTQIHADDGRPVNPELLANIQAYGRGEQALRPAIARSGPAQRCRLQPPVELPIFCRGHQCQQWAETDRVAWVRALKVDERLTVIASLAPRSNRATSWWRSTAPPATKPKNAGLADMRDRGRPFPVTPPQARPSLVPLKSAGLHLAGPAQHP